MLPTGLVPSDSGVLVGRGPDGSEHHLARDGASYVCLYLCNFSFLVLKFNSISYKARTKAKEEESEEEIYPQIVAMARTGSGQIEEQGTLPRPPREMYGYKCLGHLLLS